MRPKAEILAHSRRLRRHQRFIRGSLYFLLFSLTLGSLVYLFSRPIFFITNVIVSGAQTLNPEQIKLAVTKELQPFWRRHLFFYPRAAIENDLRAAFPLIKIVSLGLENWQNLKVEVSERQPAAIWCQSECVVVDEAGVSLAPAPTFSRPLFFTVANATSIPALALASLLLLRQGLLETLATPHPVAIWRAEGLADGDYEFTITGADLARTSWRLLVTAATPPTETIFNLRSALGTKNLAEALASGRLDYIDLRFAPKVFYKLL